MESITLPFSDVGLGAVIEMQKGDILGHEFCGKIDSVGPAVKNLKPGQRVVCSFQIACGSCMWGLQLSWQLQQGPEQPKQIWCDWHGWEC